MPPKPRPTGRPAVKVPPSNGKPETESTTAKSRFYNKDPRALNENPTGDMSSFVKLSSHQDKDRLIITASAREKCGKTHFSLTCPAPIAYFAFDKGLNGMKKEFGKKAKDIYICSIPMQTNMLNVGGIVDTEKPWRTFIENFVEVLHNDDIRTIVWDTGSELWDALRLFYFGKLVQVESHHYVNANSYYLELMRTVKEETDKNLIVLQKCEDEYKNNVATGRDKARGQKDTPYEADTNIRLFFDPDGDEEGENGDERFGFEVLNCNWNMGLVGMEFRGDLANYDTLYEHVFGED